MHKKHKKAFTDGAIVKELVIAMATETLFKDHRSQLLLTYSLVTR